MNKKDLKDKKAKDIITRFEHSLSPVQLFSELTSKATNPFNPINEPAKPVPLSRASDLPLTLDYQVARHVSWLDLMTLPGILMQFGKLST